MYENEVKHLETFYAKQVNWRFENKRRKIHIWLV